MARRTAMASRIDGRPKAMAWRTLVPVAVTMGALAAALAAPTAAAAQSPTAAQDTPADTVLLTLEEALAIARGSNPTYRQAVNSAGLNGVERRTTLFNQVLPRAQVSLFQTGFDGNYQLQALDNFGNPIQSDDTGWKYFSNTRQALSLSWQVQGRSIFQAMDRQTLTNRDRDLAEVRASTATDIAVERAFMEVLEQRALLRAEEETLEGRFTDQDAAERLFGLAMKTRVDVLNAELATEQQILAMRQQQAAFERAHLALRTVLGDDDLPPLRLADVALPVFDPATLDTDALVRTALQVNPELRQAEVAVETADLAVAEADRAWWPTLSLGASLSRVVRPQPGEESSAALFDVSFDEQLNRSFYVGLSVPMFNDFFQNRQNQQQARIERSNRLEARRETELRVEETVRGALLELNNQYESLRLSERSAEIAQEALTLAREEYRLGSRTFEALRDAFDQEAETRRQVIQARHSFVDALLSLEEAVGTTVRPAGVPGA